MGFTALGQSAYERRKRAILNYELDYDYGSTVKSLALLKYDGLFVIGFTALFLVMLFVPTIAQNPLTMRLLALIDWAYELKIIGWILRIGGALFLLAFVFQGFLLSIALMSSVIGGLRKGEGELNWLQRHLNWTWLSAYLIWFFLNASDNVAPQIIGAILILFASSWVIKQKRRRLWWILLSPFFSPLWLKNKRKELASLTR